MKREELLLARLLQAGRRCGERQGEGDGLPPEVAVRIASRWAKGGGQVSAGMWLWEQWSLRAAVAGMTVAVALLTTSLIWPAQSQAREARAAAEIELLLSIP